MDSPPPAALEDATPNSAISDYFEASLVKPLLLPQGQWSLQNVIERCNNGALPDGPFSPAKLAYDKTLTDDWLVPFFLQPLPDASTSGHTTPIGFLRRAVVDAMRADNDKMRSMRCDTCWRFYGEGEDTWAASFEGWFTDVDTREQLLALRSEHMDRMVRGWKEAGLFPQTLQGAPGVLQNASLTREQAGETKSTRFTARTRAQTRRPPRASPRRPCPVGTSPFSSSAPQLRSSPSLPLGST
jgi:hypothetical protein